MEENKWQHKYNNFKIVLTKDDPADELLLKVFKEENRVIERVVYKLTNEGTLNEILGIFIGPLIPVIVGAVNATARKTGDRCTVDDAIHFVRCLVALSIYKQSPQVFFKEIDLFPLAATLDHDKFSKVISGLNRNPLSIFEESEIMWDRPFTEDPIIREAEEAITKINRQFFIPDLSILSIDDDHLRLSSEESDHMGLPRKNNPDKAFGPVSTGVVSLTSGITLSNRIAGRGENNFTTVRALIKNIFKKEFAEHVKASNLVALDRGYLSIELIDYLSSIGCPIIGTHKRTYSYPFTFGEQRYIGSRVKVQEKGCKMVYWAKRCINGKIEKALAYRSGKGRVATIFMTSPTINEGRFIYRLKNNNDEIPKICPLIRDHINYYVKELTFGQAGVEWHFIRAGLGLITSSVAYFFFKLAVKTINNFSEDVILINLIQGLGINIKCINDDEKTYTELELKLLKVKELKEICFQKGYKKTGNKSVLINRILENQEEPLPNSTTQTEKIRSDLMGIWFMSPLKVNTYIKMGKECKPLIANKIIPFSSHYGIKIKDITEVGLVRSNESNYQATSVDRLAVLETINDEQFPNHTEDFLQFILPIEIKCMTTDETKNEALHRIRKYDTEFCFCKFGDDTFKDLVWTTSYRTQCLHHVCTYSLNKLLFVVGSDKEILYMCFINFPDEIIKKYNTVMEQFGSEHIAWYQSDENWEHNLRNVTLHHAVDVHSVKFWKNMALEITKVNHDERTRLTSAHEIVPQAVSLWNKCKGGQDVVSRQLKNVKIDFRSLKPRAYMIIRQIMTQLLNVHLVHRICTYPFNDDDETTTYHTWKNKLNKYRSFSKTLMEIARTCDLNNLNIIDLSIKKEQETEAEPEIVTGKEVVEKQLDEPVIVVPKRKRIEFFNRQGKKTRLSTTKSTDHLPITYKRNKCLLCFADTTVRCRTCNVTLCRNTYGKNRMCCYDKFHTHHHLYFSPRKGRKNNNKINVAGADNRNSNDNSSDEDNRKRSAVVNNKIQDVRNDYESDDSNNKTTTTLSPKQKARRGYKELPNQTMNVTEEHNVNSVPTIGESMLSTVRKSNKRKVGRPSRFAGPMWKEKKIIHNQQQKLHFTRSQNSGSKSL